MPSVSLSAATVHYLESGPKTGRPIVFVHGYTMSSSLWGPVTERLAARGLFCIAPTWPLGAHSEPVRDPSCLTMEGVAGLVPEILDELELEDVVLVGNDTGGALAQIVAGSNPVRIGALVLTNCDAFEDFPPEVLKPLVEAADSQRAFRAILKHLGTREGRSRAYGVLAHTDLEPLTAEWTKTFLTRPEILTDLRRFTASLNGDTMVEAAARLPNFTKPCLIAWATDDEIFPLEIARRLAAVLPNASLSTIPHSLTFSMIDQPDALADIVSDFAGTRSAALV